MPVKESQIYRRLKLIGEGSFGKAYLVESMVDGQLLVVKQMDLQFMAEEEKQEAYKEARILGQLKHPNIINFREVYKTKKGRLCIVMDYADGGDLSQKLKAQGQIEIQEQQILDWFTQMCLAIKHVHDRKIIHRDIKTQNIFLTKDGRVKLGDFGIARVLSHTREKVKTIVGTPFYLAPELIENKPYSFSGDMWSLGVVLYELCARKTPFDADNLPLLALKIVGGKFQQIPSSYSKELKSLVALLLTVKENLRPTVYQVLKLPIITNRIKNFLSETMRVKEFAHTIIHSKNILGSPIPSMKILEDAEKKQVNKINFGTPQNEKKVFKPTQVKLLRKPQTPGLFPDIKKDAQTPQSKQGLRVGTPVVNKNIAPSIDRKPSGDERDPNKNMKLPEIKLNFQGKAMIRELDPRYQIQSRAKFPISPKEKKQYGRQGMEIASKRPGLMRHFTKESLDEQDQIQLVESDKANVPVSQNFFGGSQVSLDSHPTQPQVNQGPIRPNQRLFKSPSAFEGIIKQIASDRLARLKAKVKSQGSRLMASDSEQETTPSHDNPKVGYAKNNNKNIRIHIGKQQIDKIFQNNENAHQFRIGTPLSNLMDQDINFNDKKKEDDIFESTLQKISEHGSDRRSVTKLSISIPHDETVKSSYMLSNPRNSTTLEDQQNIDNLNSIQNSIQNSMFSLTQSLVVVGNQTVRWQPEKQNNVEENPTFYEKIDPKRRKIIFKDPFSRLDSNPSKRDMPLLKQIKRDDSEEDLKQMVKELQGIILPSEQVNQEQNNNKEIVSITSSSYEDSSSDEDDDIEIDTKTIDHKTSQQLEDNPMQTLDYICGNKEIKHLKDQLKHKLNRHFDSVFGLAKEVFTYEDLGKNCLTKRIKELIPNTDQKTAEGVATLIVTLVVLAKGEAIGAL